MTEKCLIIGLGKIGMGYDLTVDHSIIHSHARAFASHSAFELSGAVDMSKMQRESFLQHYGGVVFSDLDKALDVVDPNIIVIATPTETHSIILNQVLLNSNPKAILCEKPMAYNLLEASDMLKACENAGINLFVNYIRRADPGAKEVKRRIESSEIELPVKGNVWYSKGFLNNGSHFFNLLEFWLGGFVRASVMESGRLWNNYDPEPDVQVEFEYGKIIFQAIWGEFFSHNALELICPSGRLRYEDGGNSIIWQSIQTHPSLPDYKVLVPEPESIANDMKRYQWNVINQLANALAGKDHCLCTGRQALRTLEAMHQILDH